MAQSCFARNVFYIPGIGSVNGHKTNTPTTSDTRESPPFKGAFTPRVLVVDDNPINLQLLVTFMHKLKYPHKPATNGLEAVEACKDAESPFDFILMDATMPIMDGLTTTREIRKWERECDRQTPNGSNGNGGKRGPTSAYYGADGPWERQYMGRRAQEAGSMSLCLSLWCSKICGHC